MRNVGSHELEYHEFVRACIFNLSISLSSVYCGKGSILIGLHFILDDSGQFLSIFGILTCVLRNKVV